MQISAHALSGLVWVVGNSQGWEGFLHMLSRDCGGGVNRHHRGYMQMNASKMYTITVEYQCMQEVIH